ncbi:MAG: hypothetical protein EOR72_12720 [Mesorhizobium sp.]|nr:MAG: hypothetical protein EOR72_12720 [Mesorhizobium sp.]
MTQPGVDTAILAGPRNIAPPGFGRRRRAASRCAVSGHKHPVAAARSPFAGGPFPTELRSFRRLSRCFACERNERQIRELGTCNRRSLQEEEMGRGILLWLLGVPIPIIILLMLFAR